MDIKGMTLGRVLRLRSSVANKIKQASSRAKSSAVYTDTGSTPDFKVEEQLKIFTDEQQNLRELKLKTAFKSMNTKVYIPEDVPVGEAGKEVPVYCAVLIRDDLKARKQLLAAIIELPTDYDRRELIYAGRGRDSETLPEKKRSFNFDEAVTLAESLQDSIDTIDGIIQGADATTRFE